MNIDCSEDIQKIKEAIKMIEQDKITVVLVGAFSDGKTSVIAGWLNEEKSNMKIDSDESSDELCVYHPLSFPKNCEIVDTPGLFGNKEKSSGKKRNGTHHSRINSVNYNTYSLNLKSNIDQLSEES